jgi:hypothetical protein
VPPDSTPRLHRPDDQGEPATAEVLELRTSSHGLRVTGLDVTSSDLGCWADTLRSLRHQAEQTQHELDEQGPRPAQQ